MTTIPKIPASWWQDGACAVGEVPITGEAEKAEHFARKYAEVSGRVDLKEILQEAGCLEWLAS